MKKRTEQLIELEIESIGFEGISIARKNEQVYFVRGGLPGDTVIAKVKKQNKNYIESSIKEIISPSKHRIDEFCEYFGACGGCSWQCLEYEQQLHWKKQHIIDAHSRLGKLSQEYLSKAIYHNTIPAEQTFEYRNKMDFSFSTSRWLTTKEIESEQRFNNNFALGLHIPGRFDKVLDIKNCKIQKNEWNQILDFIRQKAISSEVSAFNTYDQKGFLKGLCLRYSLKDNETMVILVTSKPQNENEKNFLAWYKSDFLNDYNKTKTSNCSTIISIVYAENTQNSVNIGEIQFIVGKEFLTESILGIDYQISSFSFFQTNSTQLNTFIKLIIDSAKLKSSDIVWDLYCGTGSITLPAAKNCKKIFGIELIESSVNDAKINAERNEILNVEFFAADLHNAKIPTLLKNLPQPDVVIIDPPRNGTNSNLLGHILEIVPQRLVYVSCNPATQARDLTELAKKYQLREVFPVDMFPHTYHIEVVAILEKI